VFILVIHGIRNTWSSPKPSTIKSGNSQLIIDHKYKPNVLDLEKQN